jgi:tRNA pseudouridine38-40 synthase
LGKFANPFESGYSWHCKFPIDVDKVKRAAGCFVGKHDFKGFMASGSSVEDTVRTVYDCHADLMGDILQISITADGFLYNMVRIIAGTLYEIGVGKIDEMSLPDIILSGVRENAGITAPAHGLFLARVDYGKDVFSP